MEIVDDIIYKNIKTLLNEARKNIVSTVNIVMVKTYYEIGRIIVEDEQSGRARATYGKELMEKLSIKLTTDYGKGFSLTNLKQMKKFYLTYQKGQTVSDQFKLSWSQYLMLCRIENIDERDFYEVESNKCGWSTRELRRNIDSSFFERLSISKNREEVKELSLKGQIIEKPKDLIKDPYVLEFLGLDELPHYSESDLENAIINHIEKFIMELGKGFLFQGRQVRFTFDEDHFFIDLVFYNRILKCFVLIDLKIGKLKHQDIGQMQMYVNYYDRHIKLNDENKTIGIIICKDKNDTLVEITLPENNEQIFASKYMTILPTKDQLKRVVEGDDV